MTKALKESFPYVRCMTSVEGWGFHFLASMSPIPDYSPAVLAARMPPAARADLMEWGPGRTPEEQFLLMLSHELSVNSIVNMGNVPIQALHDDRPVNEYLWLRATLSPQRRLSLYRLIAKWRD